MQDKARCHAIITFISCLALGLGLSLTYYIAEKSHIKNQLITETSIAVDTLENNMKEYGPDIAMAEFAPVLYTQIARIDILKDGLLLRQYNYSGHISDKLTYETSLNTLDNYTVKSYAYEHHVDIVLYTSALLGIITFVVSTLVSYIVFLRCTNMELTNDLKKSEHFWRLLLDTIPLAVFVKDEEFKIIEANRRFIELYPKEMHDQIIGFTTVESFSPEDAKALLAEDKKALDFGYSKIVETLTFANEKPRTFSTHKIKIEDVITKKKFILGVAHDITEQLETETHLISDKYIYQRALDSHPDAICIKDSNHAVVYNNRSFVEMFGKNKSTNAPLQKPFDYLPTTIQQDLFKKDLEALQFGFSEENRTIISPDDSNGFNAKWTKIRFDDNEGKTYLLTTIRKI